MEVPELAAILPKLGVDPAGVELAPTAGPLDNALLVIAPPQRYVLKYAPAHASPGLQADLRRELAFYRELAPTLPIATPRLVASWEGVEGCALLLEAHSPALPAEAWTPGMYVWAAQLLAGLHGRQPPAWLEAGPPPAEVAREWLDIAEIDPVVARVVSMASYLYGVAGGASHGICHGDCRTGNFLLDGAGNLLLANWQGIHRGSPTWDLASFLGRALAEGGIVPEEDVLEVYAEARGITSLPGLARAVAAAEAWLILTRWSPLLQAEDQRSRLLARLHELVDRLG